MSSNTYDESISWRCNLQGKTVGGKYELIRFIGSGKIGYVYCAHHKDLPDVNLAVKLIFDSLEPDWDIELKKVIKLGLTDGVVHFHDYGTDQINANGSPHLFQYTIWDFIPPGENLEQYLQRVNQIEISFLLAVIERILRVLNACYHEGVSRHGDMHPGNILIGKASESNLDDFLQPRIPIYISDFGYRTTGGLKQPKDDYIGLVDIINLMLQYINRETTSATDKHVQSALREQLGKLLRETNISERQPPIELLKVLKEIKYNAQVSNFTRQSSVVSNTLPGGNQNESSNVGSFQVTEMIGDRWEWWRRLFVPNVPARSKILALDIPTIVTGPRGCGKTMIFRRLSERLTVECGKIEGLKMSNQFVAFYVNANDIADAFSHFPEKPSLNEEKLLICYANLCVLADILSVHTAYLAKENSYSNDKLLIKIQKWLIGDEKIELLTGEDKLEKYRTILEQIKWRFPQKITNELFPGFEELSQYRWLPYLLKQILNLCNWCGERSILLFIDDYSMPRVNAPMQRILNRLFLQRSSYFLSKLATESSTTFLTEDSSGKILEDGDDFQLVDMGEESLFLSDEERSEFLNEVFARRLEADSRIPLEQFSLEDLLGRLGLSKTEFARRLRSSPQTQSFEQQVPVTAGSQRRGRSRARVLYWGVDTFYCLWSGDTRTMIQLITDVVDQASESKQMNQAKGKITLPIEGARQDLVFRNRGGEWLSSHVRNAPTSPISVKEEMDKLKKLDKDFILCGEYGEHLKAVVEAFVMVARKLLFGPTYSISHGKKNREVPRMAFRLEIIDDFRLTGLAKEIYRDLVRYGLFIRDSRGKSIRGTFVPRLFLRRLLLPYSALALSKRDSVHMKCEEFEWLLLKPDEFKKYFNSKVGMSQLNKDQISFSFLEDVSYNDEAIYDDL